MGGDFTISDKALEYLKGRILEQAADDYLCLLARFRKPSTDCNISEIKRFFHSDWYTQLCDIDPDFVLEAIERKAKSMVLKYTVSKQKNSSRYYVHEVDSKEPIPDTLGTKKQALHTAAKMNGLDYKDYMRVRRRDGAKCDVIP